MSLRYHNLPQTSVAPFIAQRIKHLLANGEKILWLMSGGSGGAVCVEVSHLLSGEDLTNLYVALTDERYGPVGHSDENMQILIDNGLALFGATLYRTLSGKSRQETTSDFADWLTSTEDQVTYKLAVLGIGEDAHTCGIKPGSSAVWSPRLADSFTGEDFERITITPTYLRTVNEGIIQAYGDSKHAVVSQLLSGGGDLEASPMLVIRDIPKVEVFSDYSN